MYHLYTEIKANLNDESYIGLIDRLHPTPRWVAILKKKHLILLRIKSLVLEVYMAHRWAILMFMMIVNSLLLYVLC